MPDLEPETTSFHDDLKTNCFYLEAVWTSLSDANRTYLRTKRDWMQTKCILREDNSQYLETVFLQHPKFICSTLSGCNRTSIRLRGGKFKVCLDRW